MFCDFRKAFGLDPEYNKQLEESMQEAKKKALKEKWCCTCEYYIPVDPNLPGFVVAYPECEKGRDPMQSCEEYRRKGYAIRNSSWADMDTEEDISSAKIKKQRGCREKLLEIRCRVL